MKNLILKLQIRFEVVINFNSYHTGAYLSFFLCVVFFRIMSGLIMFTVKLAVLITNVTIICGKIVPFQFNQFESMEDCTCVNHEFIFVRILFYKYVGLNIFPIIYGVYNTIICNFGQHN